MFTAGTDTSSSTIEWAIAELIRHREILTQVKNELDSDMGQDRLFTELDLPKLTYFQYNDNNFKIEITAIKCEFHFLIFLYGILILCKIMLFILNVGFKKYYLLQLKGKLVLRVYLPCKNAIHSLIYVLEY